MIWGWTTPFDPPSGFWSKESTRTHFLRSRRSLADDMNGKAESRRHGVQNRLVGMHRPSILLVCAVVLQGCAQAESRVGQTAEQTPPAKNVAVVAPDSTPVAPADSSSVNASTSTNKVDTLPTPDRSQWRPKMPMIRAGACPGEDCTYGGTVIACEDLQLFSTDSVGGKPLGVTLHKGDTVTVVTGNLHLLEPGIVVMKRDYAITDIIDESSDYKAPRPDTLRFFAGDTVYVLEYQELGSWSWWYRGKLNGGDEFWTGAFQNSYGPGDEQRPAVAISKPRGEWWYKLQGARAPKGGWMRDGRGRWVDRKFIPAGSDWTCDSDPKDAESDIDPPSGDAMSKPLIELSTV
jgi:hypothetical protein